MLVLLILEIIISLSLRESYGEILKAPHNNAVVVGRRDTLECSIDNELQLWSEDYNYGTITSNENVRSEYKGIYDVEGRYNLVLISPQYNKSGRHTCHDVISDEKRAAEVIVLGSDPVCSTTSSETNDILIDGEYIQYVCKINYQGKWAPIMDWISNNGKYIAPEIAHDEYKSPKILQYSYNTVINTEDQGLSVKVITSFDEPSSPGADSATNAPNYVFIWNSPSIHVHFRPTSVTFHHCNYTTCNKIGEDQKELSIQQWDWLQASADCNPSPDYYIWTHESEQIAEGPNENEFTFERNGTFSIGCVLRNTMREGIQTHIHRNILVFVDESEKPPSAPTYSPREIGAGFIAGIVILCLVGVAVITAVLYGVYTIGHNRNISTKGSDHHRSTKTISADLEWQQPSDINIPGIISNHSTTNVPSYLEPVRTARIEDIYSSLKVPAYENGCYNADYVNSITTSDPVSVYANNKSTVPDLLIKKDPSLYNN